MRHEIRELLRSEAAGRDRGAARRHADLAELAHRAKIGGAKEGDPRLERLPIGAVARFHDPQAGEGRSILRQGRGRARRRYREIFWPVENLARLALGHGIHAHGLREIFADMLKGDGISPPAIAPERIFVAKVQLAVRVVIELLHDLGVRARRWHIRLRRERFGAFLQGVMREWRRWAEVEGDGFRLRIGGAEHGCRHRLQHMPAAQHGRAGRAWLSARGRRIRPARHCART